jgi:hypothetical protein
LNPIEASEPFELLQVDIAGPYPTTTRGNKYLVIFVDAFSKYPEGFAVPSVDARCVAELLVEQIIPRHGAPKRLLSDCGSQFTAELTKEICKLFETDKQFTTPYHPECDGLVERFNRTMHEMVRPFIDDHQSNWDVLLPQLLLAYRSSVHDSTKRSPFEVLYGRSPRLPLDVSLKLPSVAKSRNVAEYVSTLGRNVSEVWEYAKASLDKSRARMKTQYDRSHKASSFEVGSLVLIHIPRRYKGKSPKLQNPWLGPYRVETKLSPVTYRLRSVLTKRLMRSPLHISKLKAFFDREDVLAEHNPSERETVETQLDDLLTNDPETVVNSENSLNTVVSDFDDDLPIAFPAESLPDFPMTPQNPSPLVTPSVVDVAPSTPSTVSIPATVADSSDPGASLVSPSSHHVAEVSPSRSVSWSGSPSVQIISPPCSPVPVVDVSVTPALQSPIQVSHFDLPDDFFSCDPAVDGSHYFDVDSVSPLRGSSEESFCSSVGPIRAPSSQADCDVDNTSATTSQTQSPAGRAIQSPQHTVYSVSPSSSSESSVSSDYSPPIQNASSRLPNAPDVKCEESTTDVRRTRSGCVF